MFKQISFITLIILLLSSSVCFSSQNGYNLKIYYDDLDVVYRTRGTMENILDRADYIIEVKDPRILIKIPGPNTFEPVKNISLSIRIRCDIIFPDGHEVSYGFDKFGKHMQINDKIYKIDKILLKEIAKHLPISQHGKINKHYGF